MIEPVVRIDGGFWGQRLEMNARDAIGYQWQQLERTGCIDNFRIAAGLIDGCRTGLFFSDSDAYKWLDAASRILGSGNDGGGEQSGIATVSLAQHVEELISLIAQVQSSDGYIYTYNQILFPGQRWVNLQLEHELYCLGHLIEAGVSHCRATNSQRLLDHARRSADLLVRDFMDASPADLDGHEEIELALIRLHRLTGDPPYLELARRFIDRRGCSRPFFRLVLPQILSTALRLRHAQRYRREYESTHPERARGALPSPNHPKIPHGTWLRLVADVLSGKNLQQHVPVHEQDVPVGHAVRFTYLETAATMLCRHSENLPLRRTLEQAWDHMVTRRMYVTGGLGSLPLIEGFGRDYELDPEVAYAETCAAIGSLLWNREMAGLTNEARYDDLFEWQLYNAASVGMAIDGRSYLYNNPLTCRDGIRRVDWYLVPCCPSNLSRLWATLGEHVCRVSDDQIEISQYFSSQVSVAWGTIRIESALPWTGTVQIELGPHAGSRELALVLRLPTWAGDVQMKLNEQPIAPDSISPASSAPASACGYTPHGARRAVIRRNWTKGDVLRVDFEMPIRFHRQDPRVPGCGGMLALSRGPLVYCLESVDNPGNIFDVHVQRESLVGAANPALLGGIRTITGGSTEGRPLTFIPYMLWGNRGPSRMTVFVN